MSLFGRNKTAFVSALIIAALVLIAVAANFISPFDPLRINLDQLRLPPSFKHWMGTDNMGRDVLSRVIFGTRVSLSVGLVAALISMVIGIVVGTVGGYVGGFWDGGLTALTDMVMAFPSLLLAIGISVVLPPGIYTVMLALSLVGWASFARLARGMVLSMKEQQFVEAARASGSGPMRVMFRHILPNCLPLIIVAGSLKVGSFILGRERAELPGPRRTAAHADLGLYD